MIRRSRPGSALAHAAREPGPALSSQEPCHQRLWAVKGRPQDAPGSSLKRDHDAPPRRQYARMAGFGTLLPVAPGATFGRSCPTAAVDMTTARAFKPSVSFT